MKVKQNEEPPFLDIGESKNQVKAKEPESDVKDQFDDNEDIMKLPLPAELQSPKMIIEEQMDKVVTNMEHYTQHQQQYQDERLQAVTSEKLSLSIDENENENNRDNNTITSTPTINTTIEYENDNIEKKKSDDSNEPAPQNLIYPTDDGSTLLERVIPEAITTTTIAKETFIVRPANGDIYSKIMDVSHQSVQKRDENITSDTELKDKEQQQDVTKNSSSTTTTANTNTNTVTNVSNTSSENNEDKIQSEQQHNGNDHGHNESIVLDIAGYKTDENKWEHKEETSEEEKEMILSKLQTETDLHGDYNRSQTDSPKPLDNIDIENKITTTEINLDKNKQEEKEGDSSKQETVTEQPTKSLWGWGKRRQQTYDSLQSNKSDEDEDDNHSIATDTSKDEEDEEKKKDKTPKKYQLVPGTIYRIEMSLCGFSAFGSDEKENANVFEEHQITYDTFMHNPNLLNDKRLVFRYEHRYYATGHTGPLFTSLLLYKKPLQETSNHDHHDATSDGTDSRESYLFGKGWRQWLSRSSVAAPSSTEQNNTNDHKKEDDEEKGKDDNNKSKDNLVKDNHHHDENKKHEDITTTFTTTTKTTTVGWNAEHEQHNTSNLDLQNNLPRKNYAKTLRLTSEQLKHLKLNKGVNTISFSVSSAYQGTATCAAKIFFWDYDVSVVISDIDGTITKSDTLGHVFTMIGKDWTHNGVAKLYTDICNNGYKILYLTSRAIGQADYTRDYLKKVEQDKYQLPDGPVIMSPDRLFTSFHREVIMRKPEAFKMACLKDILRLFGEKHNPFVAGFGNRITDAISYRSVGVPSSRIFTIDPYGDVKLELVKGFTSSYIHLNDLVDQMFPPLNPKKADTDLEYNDWNFWKQPLPEIELPELDTSLSQPTSPKPKPIKPDLTSLPNQAVVTIEKKPSRSLLRSFTSISSSSTSSLSSDHLSSPKHLSPPLVPTSSSSTDLSTSPKDHSFENNNSRSRVSSFTASIKRPSILGGGNSNNNDTMTIASTHSETSSMKEVEQDKDENNQQLPPESPTSSGIMNHLLSGSIGGVRNKLSRTFAYDSTIHEENSEVEAKVNGKEDKLTHHPDNNNKDSDNNNNNNNNHDETLNEEDEYDMDDLDCDMDDIPFI
ncbi:unnamed protein product [Cunninghamella blakesleeana]